MLSLLGIFLFSFCLFSFLLSILIHLQSLAYLYWSVFLCSLFNLAVVSSGHRHQNCLASLGTLTCPFSKQFSLGRVPLPATTPGFVHPGTAGNATGSPAVDSTAIHQVAYLNFQTTPPRRTPGCPLPWELLHQFQEIYKFRLRLKGDASVQRTDELWKYARENQGRTLARRKGFMSLAT